MRCIRAVEQGATVIAASKRLARVLTESYTAQQRAKGRSVWNTPAILPWDGFLNRLWSESILNCAGPHPVLLNAPQELAVWETIIRESAHGSQLLQIPETAQAAMDAWKLIHGYRLPIRNGHFAGSEDSNAFLEWAREFEHRRDAHGWLEPARLPDAIAALVSKGTLAAPAPLYLAGFDELTPQQKMFFEAIGPTHQVEFDRFDATPLCLKFRDSGDELRSAAAWARQRLESNPGARIGIIVPDLAQLRSKAARIFTEILHPAALPEAGFKAFHISLGAPLSDTPMIRAALLILELCNGTPTTSGMGQLLRSPWIARGDRERSERALLDVKLRRGRKFCVSISETRERAEHCPVLGAALHKLQRQVDDLPASQASSRWSRAFSQLLQAVGWPGDRTLSSQQYQTSRAWNRALSALATLDSIVGPMDYDEALERVRQIARTTHFEPEDEGAPIQIMGLFESSGLSFDHLWVTGLHDEALPAPAHHNPFLPVVLQRAHGLPHSSPARELEVAAMLMQRLVASAPEIVLSYPGREGDRELEPSPFLGAAISPPREDTVRVAAVLESFSDAVAPPVPADTSQSGGSWLLRDIAACPFRAWALNRAGAKALDEPEIGIGARDRGTAVHTALQLIWDELRDHAALNSLAPEERAAMISRHVRTALEKTSGAGRSIEQKRLEKLLCEWLELERSRVPFSVLQCEQKRNVTLAQLKIETRIDRVDELADGRRIILDYKTGEVKIGCWVGERPDEPQLPLYCFNGARIAGVAFAQIRAGEIGFRGVVENAGILPGIKRMDIIQGAPLCEQIAEWREILERLAATFCAGHAAVDPKPHACDYCGVTALCRVHDAS